MWKLITIISVVLQLSSQLLAIESYHEVSLTIDPDWYTDDDEVFYTCFLTTVKSPKDQVIVTSTAVDMQSWNSLNKSVWIEIIGNASYPEQFPKNLGELLSGITHFEYSKTPLKFITRDDFKGMATNLSWINLSENDIEDIPFDLFFDMSKLRSVSVNNNKIKRLAPNMFAKSPNLVYLKIEFNEITELHPDLFRDCPDFNVLIANNNSIEEIHENLFLNNPNMINISLRHNKIKNISIDFSRFTGIDLADFLRNAGTCDIVYCTMLAFIETNEGAELDNIYRTLPEFQQKVGEICKE